jgi:hypothetical protein
VAAAAADIPEPATAAPATPIVRMNGMMIARPMRMISSSVVPEVSALVARANRPAPAHLVHVEVLPGVYQYHALLPEFFKRDCCIV